MRADKPVLPISSNEVRILLQRDVVFSRLHAQHASERGSSWGTASLQDGALLFLFSAASALSVLNDSFRLQIAVRMARSSQRTSCYWQSLHLHILQQTWGQARPWARNEAEGHIFARLLADSQRSRQLLRWLQPVLVPKARLEM